MSTIIVPDRTINAIVSYALQWHGELYAGSLARVLLTHGYDVRIKKDRIRLARNMRQTNRMAYAFTYPRECPDWQAFVDHDTGQFHLDYPPDDAHAWACMREWAHNASAAFLWRPPYGHMAFREVALDMIREMASALVNGSMFFTRASTEW